ncbi:hypothetical protein RI844_07015 [Thalassotalea fonticola]|uniref:Phospholipase A(2) n=1 Tax=Thalassotalea fonticola TaxID=3065649 RepID=A0ABZ0GTP5_9GAMM|nr:hypothetical protein RI844_07015 [Colwelliaceae bacterium S1-1]
MKWILIIFVSFSISAEEIKQVKLQDYEPNLVGYTFDSDDEEFFLDFKLSLMYPIAKDFIKSQSNNHYFSFIKRACVNKYIKSCFPYFAFTGRFGQYIEERNSSPVISKRFNPKIFFRFELTDGYVDLEYAHESNGQRIVSQNSWNSMADDFENDGEKRSYANDYISRGWDYFGVTYKKEKINENLSIYVNYQKYFGGLLQGDIEEYFDWEADRKIKQRAMVNGLKLLLKTEGDGLFQLPWLNGYKFSLILETGTTHPFKYGTVKVEALTNIFGMPTLFWTRKGYSADFAQYYKNIESYGVAFEFLTF